MRIPIAFLVGLFASFAFAQEEWAFKPIQKSKPPELNAAGKAWAKTPVDAFIYSKLQSAKLEPSKPAEARTQIRRLYLDLIGLPPTIEQIEAFAKNPTEAAYAKIVEELLALPQYGERRARAWLDLVRFGESDGFERNAPRNSAWHYRDWVIRAFNDDLSYDRFARLQIAGDVLDSKDVEALKATGFLVTGIHNTVLGSNKVANEFARQDELEDVISNVSQTFLGLTAQCARCHDHKFDPITQTDYYRLAAALGGVQPGERLAVSAKVQKREEELRKEIVEYESKRINLEKQAREGLKGDAKTPQLGVQPIARWGFERDTEDEFRRMNAELKGGAKLERGRLILDGKDSYAITAPLPMELKAKTFEVWAQLDKLDQRGGGLITIESKAGAAFDSLVFAEQSPKKWMAGSNNFQRTRDVGGTEEAETKELVYLAIAYGENGSIDLYRNGKPYGKGYSIGEAPITFAAKDSRILFGQRHTGGGNGFIKAEIEEARLYDRALTATELRSSYEAGPSASGVSHEEMRKAMNDLELKSHSEFSSRLKRLASELATLPRPEKIFTIAPKTVPITHVLSRGNVEKPKAEVTAGGIEAIPGNSEFGLKNQAPEGDRRIALAEWIARAENPLFARVIVNRIWQEHFGVGLVDTPSDLGANGGSPSHPELLDYLANELIANEFQMKAIHKLIVTSAAYRQASTKCKEAFAVDAENRLLWRKSKVRMEAEVLRDSLLKVSGQLNPQVYGAPFHDVRTYESNGTTYYEPIDAEGTEFFRRTIYRFSPRGERSALLETFDCPDPSAQIPRRQSTTTPLQALALWNDAFILRRAEAFAKAIEKDAKTVEAKVLASYRLALGRDPLSDETKLAVAHVEKHGLKAFARVLFNLSEFSVIE